MNASFRKVLREVLSGILITKPNRRGGEIRRRRCPRTKRVSGQSRFTFGCHNALNKLESEGGERNTQKSPKTVQIYQNILKKEYVCMGMHEHVICKENCIMDSAQSNPTSTQSNNIYNTHLNAWKYSYNAHEMQCMKFLRSNLQNPSQKFCKNLFDFEKPQNYQKSQKIRLKIMKCMNMGDLGHLPSK